MWFVRKRTNINLIENYTPLLYGYLLCVLLLLEKKAYGVPTTPPEKLTQVKLHFKKL
ncbi:unnamed protein product [Brugia pahangi]|uniref:Uncharacterized protein n=1 Tax=Brugia pahangi TaxID=6280 RepID=A0A0N4TH77_BRUPA|nr:unnamed protein product [Brugia pahangi]